MMAPVSHRPDAPAIAAGIGLFAIFAGCASTAVPPPDNWDGLVRQAAPASGTLYLRPGARQAAYGSIVLEPLFVSLDPRWTPNRDIVTGRVVGPHAVSQVEKQYIEEKLGLALHEVFRAELAQAGYTVVEGEVDGALHVGLALTSVYMNTPASGEGRNRRPGTMTLVMDVSDAATGLSQARFVDEQAGRFGAIDWPNSVNNSQDYRRAVRTWARQLCEILGELNAPVRARNLGGTGGRTA